MLKIWLFDAGINFPIAIVRSIKKAKKLIAQIQLQWIFVFAIDECARKYMNEIQLCNQLRLEAFVIESKKFIYLRVHVGVCAPRILIIWWNRIFLMSFGN